MFIENYSCYVNLVFSIFFMFSAQKTIRNERYSFCFACFSKPKNNSKQTCSKSLKTDNVYKTENGWLHFKSELQVEK